MQEEDISPISTMVINECEESKEIEFFDLRSNKIRVSNRNRIMKKQLEADLESPSTFPNFSPKKAKIFESPEKKSENFLKLPPGSCLLWYILPKSAFKDMVSDYELKKCKKVFKRILQKLPECHEAHFGLGKLFAHQGDCIQALEHLEKALDLFPHDKLYTVWNLVLKPTIYKNRSEALSASVLFKSIF